MHRHPLLSCFALPALLLFLSTPTTSTSFTSTSKSAYGTLSFASVTNITYVTISNPPINLYDTALGEDFFTFLTSLDPANRTTPPPKVVVFRSADPNFFIAHINVSAFLPPFTPQAGEFIGKYQAVTRLLQNLTTTVFIAEVDGVASGAGNELLVQMDMRFAGPNARVGSLETSVGVIHAVGGLQFLGRLINKGRAMQYLLSGDSVDCATGKELGWFNDCLESRTALEATVEALVGRIALRPAAALNATKARLATLNPPLSELAADEAAIGLLEGLPETLALTNKFLELGKDQTRTPFELGLDGTLAALYQ